jgi:hypothetical protein
MKTKMNKDSRLNSSAMALFICLLVYLFIWVIFQTVARIQPVAFGTGGPQTLYCMLFLPVFILNKAGAIPGIILGGMGLFCLIVAINNIGREKGNAFITTLTATFLYPIIILVFNIASIVIAMWKD